MAEIEAQTVGRVQRAALRDMLAKGLPQSLVQQMRGGVVRADRRPASVVHLKPYRSAHPKPTIVGSELMGKNTSSGKTLRIRNETRDILVFYRPQPSLITNLAASLSIERRLVNNNPAGAKFLYTINELTV